jgi:hypothetical protein
MHEVSPGQKNVNARTETPSGMPGRVTGCEDGREAEQLLAVVPWKGKRRSLSCQIAGALCIIQLHIDPILIP